MTSAQDYALYGAPLLMLLVGVLTVGITRLLERRDRARSREHATPTRAR